MDADALRRGVRMRTSTNLIHQATQLKVDLFVAGGTPLDDRQLARRLAVDLGEGRRLHVHPPEDILLQKLRWYRRGGEVSDRQWRDISAIVRVQGPRLDREYLRDGAGVLGVSDLLERALAEKGEEQTEADRIATSPPSCSSLRAPPRTPAPGACPAGLLS